MEIRQIRTEDCETLANCINQCCLEGFMVCDKELPLVQYRKWITKAVMEQRIFSVLVDNGVKGWCEIQVNTEPNRSHVGILTMGLLKKYRGHGFGIQLLTDVLKKSKHERIELWVFEDNIAAKMLYYKCGFKQEGIRKYITKMPDGTYRNEILMAKVNIEK